MAGWMREVLEVQEVLDVLNVLEVVDVLEVLEVLEVQIEPVVDGEEVSRRLGTPEPWAEGRGQCPGSPLLAGLGPARAGWAPEVWAEDRRLQGREGAASLKLIMAVLVVEFSSGGTKLEISQWTNPLLSIFSFVTGQKLKKQSFEAQSLNHSGKDQFDPVLAKHGGEERIKKMPE